MKKKSQVEIYRHLKAIQRNLETHITRVGQSCTDPQGIDALLEDLGQLNHCIQDVSNTIGPEEFANA